MNLKDLDVTLDNDYDRGVLRCTITITHEALTEGDDDVKNAKKEIWRSKNNEDVVEAIYYLVKLMSKKRNEFKAKHQFSGITEVEQVFKE